MGGQNSRWSGEMRRYLLECRWGSRPAGPVLTLRHESVGANRIRYPGSPRRKRCTLDRCDFDVVSVVVKTISVPPGEYGRKAKTQMN